MIKLFPTKYPSAAVDGIAFVGQARGDLHIQFRKDDGTLTNRGFYSDVPRAIFNSLLMARKPGAFIHEQLKTHFEWHVFDPNAIEAEPVPVKQPPIPDFWIPAWVPCTTEAIEAFIKKNMTPPERTR